jgi:hypothetical protein
LHITVGNICSCHTQNLKININLNRQLHILLVSNSNIMKDFKLEDCIKKLETLEKSDRVNMLWQWTKQGNINLTQFRTLLSYCC